MHDYRDFWQSQTSSLHRYADAQFFEWKAEEHVSFITPEHRSLEFVDLGCGAGELLRHLCRRLRYTAAIDYSPSMLDVARTTIQDQSIDLVCDTAENYLASHQCPGWTTTGAVNQYLAPLEQFALLRLFAVSKCAKAYYMFDCVDPLRYQFLHLGSSYLNANRPRLKTTVERAIWIYRVGRGVASLARRWDRCGLSEGAARLPGKGMGWGFLPAFWMQAAAELGLAVRFGSSRTYEYRYHVAISKACTL
jgi:SAM-dependent methyltransferase